jgi:hypothetical protein
MEFFTDMFLETLATALNPFVLVIGITVGLALITGFVARAIEAFEALPVSWHADDRRTLDEAVR